MNHDEILDDPYYEGICLFCGHPAVSKFESGSCVSYLTCNCKPMREYYECRKNLKKAGHIAIDRYNGMMKQEKIESLERELARLKREG